MKKQISFLILGLFITLSCGKIAGVDEFDQLRKHADDSSLTEEQKTNMQYNASILAYQELIKDDSAFIDIEEDLIDFYYDVLVTVMTSDVGKAYSITSNIRAFNHVNLTGLLARPVSGAPFIQAWQDSIVQTGIVGIDSLLSERGFELYRISSGNNSPQYYTFTNSTPTNTPRVGELLEETGHFEWAGTNALIGDGSKLLSEKITNQRESMLKVSYILGSGDCPAGCINHHWYVFHVYEDGQVQFINEFDGPRPGY